jgi:uncharacterized protein HemY
MQGEFDKVLADLDTSLRLSPDHPLVLNNLSWLLATCPDHRLRDAERAIKLANKALKVMPLAATTWNTLGVAQYRVGEWQAARESLQKSMKFSDGGSASDWLFLAMAHWQLGNEEDARMWYGKAIDWMDGIKPNDEELLRFRSEATQLLGLSEKEDAQEHKRNEPELEP